MTSKPSSPVRPRPAPRLLPLLLAAAVAWTPAASQSQARTDPPMPAGAPKTPVTLNFVNADIEAVSRAIATMLDRQILVDPRVKGQITVTSEKAVPPQEAWRSYLAALRGLGFTVVENAGLLKVLPEAEAKLQSGVVSVGAPTYRGDQVLTQIFRLNYENPNNLVATLRPLISANMTINANPGNGSLVITDYADNLQRLGKIIAALDQPASSDMEVIPVRNALASDLAPLVEKLLDSSNSGASPAPTRVRGAVATASSTGSSVLVDPRTNSLIIRAPTAGRMSEMRAIIAKLDTPQAGGGPAGNIWVVYLKNADAVRLADVLRAAISSGSLGSGDSSSGSSFGRSSGLGGSSSSSSSSSSTGSRQTTSGIGGTGSSSSGIGSAAAEAPVSQQAGVSTGGMVQADPATNSLIITAPEPVYRQMRQVIDKLDARRAQVFIESMIVEMDAQKAADFGFQWQGLLGNNGDRYGVVGGTNFGSGGSNIINLSLGAASGEVLPGNGLNIGILQRINGIYTLGALANFLQNNTDANILSTPNLVTLDNEEAKFVAGQNVPFVTGSYTSTGTTSAVGNPFQTIERQDVGLTLRVKPQIGENGTIRMTIYQENSSVVSGTATAQNGPTTNKSAIETTVVVDDGSIMVLGGLLKDSYSNSQSKVPGLGDLPAVGALFRQENRTRQKQNLMVFLRPVVMRDQLTSDSLTVNRYESIRALQQERQPERSWVTPINESPVMPPLRPGVQGDTASPAALPPAAGPQVFPVPSPAAPSPQSNLAPPAAAQAASGAAGQ